MYRNRETEDPVCGLAGRPKTSGYLAMMSGLDGRYRKLGESDHVKLSARKIRWPASIAI
jgi:hypothetical protein